MPPVWERTTEINWGSAVPSAGRLPVRQTKEWAQAYISGTPASNRFDSVFKDWGDRLDPDTLVYPIDLVQLQEAVQLSRTEAKFIGQLPLERVAHYLTPRSPYIYSRYLGGFDPEVWAKAVHLFENHKSKIMEALSGSYIHPVYSKVKESRVAILLISGLSPLSIIKNYHPETQASRREAHLWLSDYASSRLPWLPWLQEHLVSESMEFATIRSEAVIRWLARQKERGMLHKLRVVREAHGPGGQVRLYTLGSLLDEIQDEDLIRGSNTRIEDAFQHSSERQGLANLEALTEDDRVLARPPAWLHPRFKRSTRALVRPSELVAEGKEQAHCVGGYVEAVKRGQSVILALRVGNLRSTAEVSPEADRVFQHRGERNSDPHPVLKRLLEKVLNRARQYNSQAKTNGFGLVKPWWELASGDIQVC